MRHSPRSVRGTVQLPWLRKYGLLVRLAGCFFCVLLAMVSVGPAPDANLISLANGVLLSYLLLAPRKRWGAYLGAGTLALAVSACVSAHWRINLELIPLNLAEILICAFLLRRRLTDIPRFTNGAYLLRFMGYVMLGPILTGLVFALVAGRFMHIAPGQAFLQWTATDCMGLFVATPALVAILRGRFRKAAKYKEDYGWIFLLGVVTIGVFSQSNAPVAFLVFPFLILILLRLDLGWAAVGALFVAGAGNWFTVRGMGPFAMTSSFGPLAPEFLMQIFVACGLFMLYSVSMVLERQLATERRLQDIAALHALVTENSRDTIIVADFDGHRSYVSAASEQISGWKPGELLKQGTLDLVHPMDIDRVQEVIAKLDSTNGNAVVEFRMQKRSGEYIWVESSLRVVCDAHTGAPSGILNLVRDISERKQAEQRLQDAYNAVEALAVTDALTGLANRRRFDQCLTAEWRRGMRERTPLSVLMIDADLFKKYNDTYGHPRGDSCLKQIAEAAMDVVARPGDLVARFGGEEFTVVLPNTDNEGAYRVGVEICEAMRNRRLAHCQNPFGIVTISIGCATMTPKLGQHAPDLLEMADQALYKAKQNGRNQVWNGNISEESNSEALAVQGDGDSTNS